MLFNETQDVFLTKIALAEESIKFKNIHRLKLCEFKILKKNQIHPDEPCQRFKYGGLVESGRSLSMQPTKGTTVIVDKFSRKNT